MKNLKIASFFLLAIAPLILKGKTLDVHISEEGVCFMEGSDSILFYQSAAVSMHGTVRSNYIHPLFNLDGDVITENAPADHLHQRGIYWAWHQLYIGDKRIGDGWELKDIHWDIVKLNEWPQKKNERSIAAEVLWKSPLWVDEEGYEKPFVKENTTITVYPIKSNFRQFDIEIQLLALENEIRIGGSKNAKGYGGFSARIRLGNEVGFSSLSGSVTPENLPVKGEGWINIIQKNEKSESTVGVCILAHSSNPGYPNPWILRDEKSMQNAVFPHPGAQPIVMSTIVPIVLKYRIIIHKGDLGMENISKIHHEFISR